MTNQTSNIIVTFDGKYLSYEKDGQLVKIPAFSGQPGYQNPEKNQDLWNNKVGRGLGNDNPTNDEIANRVKNAFDNNELILDHSDARKYEEFVYLSQVDNSRFDLEVRTDQEFDFEQRQEETGGNVIGDADWEGKMSTINDDGLVNTAPGGIVSDNLEPGAKRLADTRISDGIDRNAENITEAQQGFLDRVGSSIGNAISAVGGFFSNILSNTGLFGGKEEIRNIDPLVADLNGDGVKLTHYNDSKAVFDPYPQSLLGRLGYLISNWSFYPIFKQILLVNRTGSIYCKHLLKSKIKILSYNLKSLAKIMRFSDGMQEKVVV